MNDDITITITMPRGWFINAERALSAQWPASAGALYLATRIAESLRREGRSVGVHPPVSSVSVDGGPERAV